MNRFAVASFDDSNNSDKTKKLVLKFKSERVFFIFLNIKLLGFKTIRFVKRNVFRNFGIKCSIANIHQANRSFLLLQFFTQPTSIFIGIPIMAS